MFADVQGFVSLVDVDLEPTDAWKVYQMMVADMTDHSDLDLRTQDGRDTLAIRLHVLGRFRIH